MNINAILTFNDKSNPLTEDFDFNIKELNDIKLQSQVYSLPPLYKHLTYRTEELAQIDAAGNLGNPIEAAFSGVDAGQLLMRFLRDLQKFLNKTDNADTTSSEITKILNAKNILAANIAAALSTLTDAPVSNGSTALSNAAAAFKQYLDTDITNTYLAGTLLQFGASQTDSIETVKYINSPVKTDQPEFQTNTKGTLTLVQQADTYQPAVAQEGFLQNNTLSLSYQVQVPIPLTAVPTPPVFLKQEAIQASPDGTQDVKKLTLWDYNFSFILPQDARDQVIIDVKFNSIQADGLVSSSTSTTDLFSALSQYQFVAVDLWKILDTDNPTSPSVQYLNAVKTFANLIENIVAQWSVRSGEPAPVVPPAINTGEEITYQFITRSNYNESGELRSVTLSSLSNNNETIAWPALNIKDTAGLSIELKSEKLTEYSFLYIIPEETSLTHADIQFSFQALDFEKVIVAKTEIKTIRNQELSPGIVTNPLFVLLSGITATDPVSPTYVFNEPINITKPGSDFATQLGLFFMQLFGTATEGKIANIEVSYSQPVSIDEDGNAGPIVKIPVVLLPAVGLSTEIADGIAKTVEEWFDSTKPSTQKADWSVALKVSEEAKPDSILLSISQLVYQLSN